MNIYITPKRTCKMITFRPENIDDGIKIGLLKAKLNNHKIPHNLEMEDGKIQAVSITDFDLIKLMLGVE